MKWISCKDKLPQKSGYYITLVFCRDGIIRTAVMKYKYNDPKDKKYGFWIYRNFYETKSHSILLHKDDSESYHYIQYEDIFLVLYWSEIDFKEEDWIKVEDKLPEKSGYYFVKALFKDGVTRIGLVLFRFNHIPICDSKVCIPEFFITKPYDIISKKNPSFFLLENNKDAFYLNLDSRYKYENVSIMSWSRIIEPFILSKKDIIKNNIIISNRICR